MTEQWRPVLGWERLYEVSSAGRVRSLPRLTVSGVRGGAVLASRPDKDGYRLVGLCNRRIRNPSAKVHVLVTEAFHGQRPQGLVVRHLDGNCTNNCADNLRWGTYTENAHDQVRHGTHSEAAKTHCPNSHPYDEANTYIIPSTGGRACRRCNRSTGAERQARYRRSKSAARQARAYR